MVTSLTHRAGSIILMATRSPQLCALPSKVYKWLELCDTCLNGCHRDSHTHTQLDFVRGNSGVESPEQMRSEAHHYQHIQLFKELNYNKI